MLIRGIVTSPTSPYTARSEPSVTAILNCAGAGSHSAAPWSVRTRLPDPQFALDWGGKKGGGQVTNADLPSETNAPFEPG